MSGSGGISIGFKGPETQGHWSQEGEDSREGGGPWVASTVEVEWVPHRSVLHPVLGWPSGHSAPRCPG